MLPSELLSVRFEGSRISPAYVHLTPTAMRIAEELMELHARHVGARMSELSDELALLDGQANEGSDFWDWKLARGLCYLIERRCAYKSVHSIEPFKARRVVFEEANALGGVTDEVGRKRALERAAIRLGVSIEKIEEAMRADSYDRLVLESFRPLPPERLIAQYNLSLTQTLLFRALDIEVTARARFKELLRHVKKFGLMYNATMSSDGECRIRIEGPASVLHAQERYGTSIAKLFPVVIQMEDWAISANIARRDPSGNMRAYEFAISSKDGDLFLDGLGASEFFRSAYEPGAISSARFDSEVERQFYNDFVALGSNWAIKREPDILVKDNVVMIPDFAFELRGMKYYLEIVGFWTEEYIERKAAKLALLNEGRIMLAIDEALAGRMRKFPNAFYYSGRVPTKPVVAFLNAREEEMLNAEREKAGSIVIPTEDVVDLARIADDYGVGIEVVVAKAKEERSLRWWGKVLGKQLISRRRLVEVKRELDEKKVESYSEASRIISSKGIADVDAALAFVGYAVKWLGLDASKARIVRADA